MRKRNLITGVFVVAGIGLFTLAIFLIGNQNKVFAKHVEFYTELANVDGLIKGAEVQVAGFDAGEVTDIAAPRFPSSKFRLRLRVVERVHGLIRSDSLVTVATEGVVGNKFLLIHQGSARSPEATPDSTLPSKEPLDMGELLEKGAGLLDSASGTMKGVADKLNGTLDAVRTTVNNANDLVVGVKEGKGTVGMLLRDESTADNIRQAISNINQSTASIRHASEQGDAMITDFHSRDLGRQVDGIMSSARSTVQSLDATSQQLHQTVTKALGPDAQGIDAGAKIQRSLSNLDQATGNMAEDTEALKHEFFFRGFFRKRGYYSLANLDPERYRKEKRFTSAANPRIWIAASDLFARENDGSIALTAVGKARLDSAVAQLGGSAVERSLVIEGYATGPQPGRQLALSRTRAVLVRNYLRSHFQLNPQHMGTVALCGVPPPATHKDTWDGISIVLLNSFS